MIAIATVAVVAANFLVPAAQARPTGIFDYSGNPDAGGGATCLDCHAPGAGSPVVTIDAPTAVNGLEPVTVSVTITGGPGAVAGFNASVSDLAGTLISTDGETNVGFDQITHTAPKAFSGGAATFTFDWIPPAEAGDVVFYASGLSANGNGANTGDGTSTSTLTISVAAADVAGDVNCSGEANVVDSLFVAQYDVVNRIAVDECPIDELTELVAANGDVNGDERTDIVDALFIAQCDTNVSNVFCPDDE